MGANDIGAQMPPQMSAEEAQIAKQAQRAALEAMVWRRLKEAKQARQASGIEQIWQEDEDQYNGYDELNPAPGQVGINKAQINDSGPHQPMRSRVYLNITQPKVDIAVSRAQELLLPTDDKPWELGPTPVPDLQRAAESEDQRAVTLADGQQAPAFQVARATMIRAKEAADRMSAHIEDWFVEGGVYAEMRKVLADAGKIGTGIIKGPVPMMRRRRSWTITDDGQAILEDVDEIKPTSKRISAWDFWPDPGCGDDIHRGAYCIEREYMTGRALRDMASMPDVDREALILVFQSGPQASADDNRPQRDGELSRHLNATFEAYYYYGDIETETLLAGEFVVVGLTDKPDDAEQMVKALSLVTVPVIVMVVCGKVIRVTLNPHETGELPFDLIAWDTVDGQPHGRSMTRRLAHTQRMLNGATRALMLNTGISRGPQVVIDKMAIEPADSRYVLEGPKLWFWTSNEEAAVRDVRKAFQSHLIPSAQAELMGVAKFAIEMSDMVSNMPLMLQGVVGSAPDTVGGMQMLEQSAASPLRALAKRFDDRLIVPHLTRYYAWAMADPDIPAADKGDMRCHAKGATVLIQRDQAAVFLASAAQMAGDPEFRISKHKLFEQYARAHRQDASAVQWTDDEWRAIQERQQQSPPPVDPRVEAAKINQETKREESQARVAMERERLAIEVKESELDRMAEIIVKEMEREIQTMEFAAQRNVELDKVKAMLTKAAMDIRNKREMFAAEREFAVNEGDGRGL